MRVHARSILAFLAAVLLGIEPPPRCSTPLCAYRARGPRDLARHERVCPWRVTSPAPTTERTTP